MKPGPNVSCGVFWLNMVDRSENADSAAQMEKLWNEIRLDF